MNCLLEQWSLTKQRAKQITKFVQALERAIQVAIPGKHAKRNITSNSLDPWLV